MTKAWAGWVEVLFDDGAVLDVELDSGSEGTAWRWETTGTSSGGAPQPRKTTARGAAPQVPAMPATTR